MEEVRYRLKHGRPGMAAGALAKLAEGLRRSQASAKVHDLGSLERLAQGALLWQGCLEPKASVALPAVELLLSVVLPDEGPFADEGGLAAAAVSLPGLLASVMAAAPRFGCPRALVELVTAICLRFPGDLESQWQQHPYIDLLQQDPDRRRSLSSAMASKLRSLLNRQQRPPGQERESRELRFAWPVLLHVFCDPKEDDYPALVHLEAELREILRSSCGSTSSDFGPGNILGWMPAAKASTSSLTLVLDIVDRMSTTTSPPPAASSRPSQQLPYLCALALQVIETGVRSPEEVLAIVHSRAAALTVDSVQDVESANVSIILLARMLESASITDADEIARCALQLASRPSMLGRFQLATFVAPLLQIVAQSSADLQGCRGLVEKSARIMAAFSSGKSAAIPRLRVPSAEEQGRDLSGLRQSVLPVGGPLLEATHLNGMMCRLQDEASVQVWLKQLAGCEQRGMPVSDWTFLSLCSAFLTCDKFDVVRTTLDRLDAIVASPAQSGRAQQVLALIMFKLATSRFEEDPRFYIRLLGSLPGLARDKCCISLVVQFIESLSARPRLAPFKLKLLYDLWLIDDRCYIYLQRALEASPTHLDNQLELAKAFVIREICRREASRYGKDLVATLSGILNRCCSSNPSESALADVAALALDGIRQLCLDSVIDIRTTADVISPKLRSDSRPRVLGGLCGLLAVAGKFNLGSQAYLEFVGSTLEYLWGLIEVSPHAAVRRAASESICAIDLNCTTLKMMPAYCKRTLKLPLALCQGTAPVPDGAQDPLLMVEDVLSYVPGEAWLNLLLYSPHLDEDKEMWEGFLSRMATGELQRLPRAVYHVSRAAVKHRDEEPHNLAYLPEKSILRAITSYLLDAPMNVVKTQSPNLSEDEGTALPCLKRSFLRILANMPPVRPLPPLDWAFFFKKLNVHEEQEELLLRIICHQAQYSSSAKKVLETILTSRLAVEKAPAVFDLLSDVCAVPDLQPLDGYLKDSLKQWTLSALRDPAAIPLFLSLMDGCKKFLGDSHLANEHKKAVCAALTDIKDHLVPLDLGSPSEAVSQLRKTYLEALAEMPLDHLENLIAPNHMWQIDDSKMWLAISLREKIACSRQSDTPLSWLNDCVDVLTTKGYEGAVTSLAFDSMLRALVTVFVETNNSTASEKHKQWFVELMGRIWTLSRQRRDKTDLGAKEDKKGSSGFDFIMDVFCLVVELFAQLDTYFVSSVSKDEALCRRSSWKIRLDLLPMGLERLVQGPWKDLSRQLAEWTLSMIGNNSGVVSESYRQALRQCLPIFKDCKAVTEGDRQLWRRIISCQ